MSTSNDSKSSHCEALSCVADHDRNSPDVDLLTPLTIRSVTTRNRIVVSPMCQYVAKDGFADDWHLVHLGSRAAGGAGIVFVEATAICPEGRITPGDVGIWSDDHIAPLARIAAFLERMGAVPAIQIAHAGRKASCLQPWIERGRPMTKEEGAWQTVAPSPLPFNEGGPPPKALTVDEIASVKKLFVDAAKRALSAGFKIIEVHSAHGYLLHSFLSPLTNKRTDNYGGSLENRMRFLLETADAVRKAVPETLPVFVRISTTDWMPDGWDIEQSVALAKELKKLDIDLVDASTGGVVPSAKIPVGPNYQVPFAARIRQDASIMTGAVGLITQAQQANDIVISGSADLVFIGREMLREPYFALHAEQALNEDPEWPLPYGYAVRRHKR